MTMVALSGNPLTPGIVETAFQMLYAAGYDSDTPISIATSRDGLTVTVADG